MRVTTHTCPRRTGLNDRYAWRGVTVKPDGRVENIWLGPRERGITDWRLPHDEHLPPLFAKTADSAKYAPGNDKENTK